MYTCDMFQSSQSHLPGRTTDTFPKQGQQNGLLDVKLIFFNLDFEMCHTHKMAL